MRSGGGSDRRLTRRGALKAGGAGAAAAATLGLTGCFDGGDGDGANEMNIVLIVIDTVRLDHVGAYGSKGVRTPNIDALAAESLRFTNAVPEAMPTIPARRAIYTGRRSFPFRDWRAQSGLPQTPGWMSIPRHQTPWLEWAARAGYATALSTDVPFLVGPRYDGFRSKIGTVAAFAGEPPLRDRPRDLVSDRVLARYTIPALKGTRQEERLREYLSVNPPGRPEREHLCARTFGAGMRMLEKLKRRRPFALVVDTFSPHESWDPPAKYVAMYGDPDPRGVEPIQPFETPFGRVEQLGLDADLLNRVRTLYAAEVSFADAWLGRLLQKLDDLDLEQETMVLFLADHGVSLGERGIIGKKASEAFGEIHRVPYMIRDPEGRRAGERSPYFASTHDVAPTLLTAAGIGVPGAMDGEDLTPLFDRAPIPERPVFTAAYADQVLAGDGRWFLIADNLGERKRLYRGLDDSEDVSASHRDVVDRLWGAIIEAAGGPLPRFGPDGVIGL